MVLFEWTIALLLVAVLLSGIARRIGVPYPTLLAVAGAGLAFLPFSPDITIDPDLALALFIAPILLDAGFDTSPRELRRNLRPLAALVVVAVFLTTAAVALVGYHVGGLPLAAAIALGAIVAPPDAASAAAVLGQVNPPRRLVALLQGESLLNDATSLLLYRVAVTAAAGSLTLGNVAPVVAISVIGSPIVGYALARLYLLATRRVEDPASATVLQFVSTFAVWLLAERLELSAIITMVVFAITLGRYAPKRMSPRNRVSSYSVWETIVFVLNVLAFLLMGLQARPILQRLSGADVATTLGFAAAVLAVVIAVRLIWVFLYGGFVRRRRGRPQDAADDMRGDLLIGWCGMRGLVTLATAFALPQEFPGRDLIVLTAFCVVLGTLVLQGITLGPLLKRLNFSEDSSLDEEISRGRLAVLQAALGSLEGETSDAATSLRTRYTLAQDVSEDPGHPQGATEFDRLRLRAIERQRDALHRLWSDGGISDEAFHRLEEEIDWAELDAAPAGHFRLLTT